MINTDTQRTIQRSSSWAINYLVTDPLTDTKTDPMTDLITDIMTDPMTNPRPSPSSSPWPMAKIVISGQFRTHSIINVFLEYLPEEDYIHDVMLMVLMLMMMFTLCFMWPQAGDLQCPPLLGVCLKISAEVSQMGKHLQNPPNNIYAQFGDKRQREIRRQA